MSGTISAHLHNSRKHPLSDGTTNSTGRLIGSLWNLKIEDSFPEDAYISNTSGNIGMDIIFEKDTSKSVEFFPENVDTVEVFVHP